MKDERADRPQKARGKGGKYRLPTTSIILLIIGNIEITDPAGHIPLDPRMPSTNHTFQNPIPESNHKPPKEMQNIEYSLKRYRKSKAAHDLPKSI